LLSVVSFKTKNFISLFHPSFTEVRCALAFPLVGGTQGGSLKKSDCFIQSHPSEALRFLSPLKGEKFCALLFFLFLSIQLLAQDQMQVARYNFTNFPAEKKNITSTLIKNTPVEMQQHPEFGILPYKAGCNDCVELIQKRDFYSRYYVEPNNLSHFYSQKSYFPLHYKDENDLLRTIDPRLKQDAESPWFFLAENQPVPTAYDLREKTTYIVSAGFLFEFNRDLKIYFETSEGNKTGETAVNFSSTTVGQSGVFTTSAWNQIDVRQIFKQGGIKTDFILNARPNIPANSEWLVFEDELYLPDDFKIVSLKNNTELSIQKDDWEYIHYNKPTYYDGYGLGITGSYAVETKDNYHAVKVLIPVAYLTNPGLRYPVYIDPWVFGRDSIGNFINAPGDVGAALAFTQTTLGSCDYTVIDTVPGKSELFDVLVDLEYEVSDSLCVPSPPNPSPFCYFFDLTMEVVGPCGSTGQLICQPANPPFLGTCTTDPDKVPGAGMIRFSNFAHCVPPQCPDYIMPFTLKNRSLQCLETCGYNCAIGSFFAVTVEGRTIELDVTADKDSVCINEPVRLTSFPDYGVPPYRYVWTPSRATDSISTVYPGVTASYIDTAFDICDNWAVDSLRIVVKPTPTANAGTDVALCDGDAPVTIGGNPTGPTGSTYQWTAEPSTANGFISGTTNANPFVAIPAGTTGSFEFIVRVEDAQCFRYDTVLVDVATIPAPVIAADTLQVCEGSTITLSVMQPFTHYVWSTGDTTNTISVTQSGIYTVTVTNANGCTGDAASPQVSVVSALAFTVFPKDEVIELGGSVTLGADINLAGVNVSNYIWTPNQFISCTDCPSPIVTSPADQLYTLEVTSTDGCTSSDNLLIRVILPDAYAIPSAFSPNEDGKNDRFFILKASGVTVKEFKIFNRWGQMIHNATVPWDGAFKDAPQDMGVYSYLFVLQLFDGREVKESGDVTLVR